ncbi:MAG: hypothetical protein ACI9C4_002180 [Paraglaciecola sp.]|jgi:hypothetical protein
MDRHPRHGIPDKAIQTVCVGGVYIVDKRIGYERRHKIHIHKKEYDPRLSNRAKSFNRRRRFIDIVI